MKLKELITEGAVGDFVSAFKQGYQQTGPGKGAIKKQFKRSSPWDTVDPAEMKMIIDAVLNKKPLTPEQEVLLRKLHKRL